MSSPLPAVSLPVLKLKKRHALPLFQKHPWVYATAIADEPNDIEVGSEVIVQSAEGQSIARGLYNPSSLIRVRLFTWDLDEHLDADFWQKKIQAAVRLRKQHLGQTNSCRLIFSEADGLSGLTVDVYGEFLLVQLTSQALATRQMTILNVLAGELRPKGIWLRTEKGMRDIEGLDLEDRLYTGEEPPRPLFIEENGLQFGVDVVEGQKTGFYFDQRENRAAVAKYCKNARVFDGHCYTGGFSLVAASLGKAKSVLGVDSSEASLRLAKGNADLNGLSSQVQFEKADVKLRLEQAAEKGEEYDVVILDPPKLARTRGGLRRALKAYQKLNEAALAVIKPGGILVTCSCSGLVTSSDFDGLLARAAVDSGKNLRIVESRRAAIDHPFSVVCPESDYLKCRICVVD